MPRRCRAAWPLGDRPGVPTAPCALGRLLVLAARSRAWPGQWAPSCPPTALPPLPSWPFTETSRRCLLCRFAVSMGHQHPQHPRRIGSCRAPRCSGGVGYWGHQNIKGRPRSTCTWFLGLGDVRAAQTWWQVRCPSRTQGLLSAEEATPACPALGKRPVSAGAHPPGARPPSHAPSSAETPVHLHPQRHLCAWSREERAWPSSTASWRVGLQAWDRPRPRAHGQTPGHHEVAARPVRGLSWQEAASEVQPQG